MARPTNCSSRGRRRLFVIGATGFTLASVACAVDLDWTFVRPTYLQDRKPTGRYRATDDSTPRGGWRITRTDVARFIVDELDAHRWSRQAPSLAE